MTAALIALALLAAGLGAALVACGWRLYGALQVLEPERARTATAIRERDAAHVTLAARAAAIVTLTERLRRAELALNAHTTEAADAAADSVRTAPDPLDEFNRVFAEPLVPADDPAAPGRDGAGADAVPAAAAVGGAAGTVGGA